MVDLTIKNGILCLEDGLIRAGLCIDEGKIAAVGKESALPRAETTIDATGKIVLPGVIDVHTHMLDLLYAFREDFVTGTKAAASGGVTTFLEMPLGIEGKNALHTFDMQLNAMKEKCLVDFGLIGSAGHTTVDFISELARRGCSGFKTFMISPSKEEAELQNLAGGTDYQLLKIFSEIAETKLTASVHAENDSIIAHNIQKLQSQNKTDLRAHTASRPPIAEDEACARALVLAHHAKVHLNLVHLSSENAFAFVRAAKRAGWNVTCEVTPHHLLCTSQDGERSGAWAKVDPPLRSQPHVAAAQRALNDGTIDMVASDHSPYTAQEKNSSNIFECGSGTPGVETLLPVLLDAVAKKKITLKNLVHATALNPARRFRLYPQKGTITVGSDADIVLVDMKKKYTLKGENLFTKPKVTVFEGTVVQGRVEKTLVRGKIVYDNGDFYVEKGYGKFVTPSV